MKILQYAYSPVIGGILKHVVCLAKQLKKRNLEVVTVINRHDAVNPIVDELEICGIPCYRAAVEGKSDLSGLFYFLKILRKEQPDTIHFHLGSSFENFLPIVFAGLHRSKVIITEHSPFYPGKKRWYKHFLKAVSLRSIQNIILLGDQVKDQYLSSYRVSSEKLTVIPPFSDVLKTREIGKISTLGFVGEFSRNKGVHLLIDFAPSLIEKGYNLTFCGRGELQEDITRLQEQFPGRIEIQPFSLNQEVCYRHIDVLLLLSEYEGFPLVVLEAISSGIPVISTDVGVIREYFSYGEGILFIPERTPEQLVVQLEHLREKKFLQDTIRKGREKFYHRLTPEMLTSKMVNLYHS